MLGFDGCEIVTVKISLYYPRKLKLRKIVCVCCIPYKIFKMGVLQILCAPHVLTSNQPMTNFTSRVSHHFCKQSKRLIVWFFFFSANDASYKHRKESQRESEVQSTVFSHLFSPHFFQCQISRLEFSKRACYHIFFINMEFRGTFHVVD